MGFLAGFGKVLSESADLQQRAKIAQSQELMRANLKLAELLLGGDEEQQAQGLAIIADPTKPFRMDKPHPDLDKARNVLGTMGAGGPGQMAVQEPSGMAGMLGLDQSPLQGAGYGAPLPPPEPEPLPVPPLPPQPAAMSTAQPANQGGALTPAAAGSAPVPPQGAPQGAPQAAPPAPVQAAPPPGPPAPPQGLPQPAPAPPEIPPELQALLAPVDLPPAPLNAQLQQDRYRAQLEDAISRQQAKAAALSGASPEEVRAIRGGRGATSVITTGMREAGKTEDRAARERMAAERAKGVQEVVQARIAEAQSRREQTWAMHKDRMGVAWQRLAGSADKAANRAETARLTKLQEQGRQAQDFASNGIAGLENLRGLYQLYADATSVKEKVIAWERFVDGTAAEAQRITQAASGPNIKGARMNEARVRAAIKEITTTHKAWIPGAPAIPLLAPDEVEKRLDNVRHLVEQSEAQARDAIQAAADNPPAPGKSPLTPTPERGRAVHGKIQEPPKPPKEVQGVGKTIPAAKVREVAARKGITFEAAKKDAEAQGYRVE